MAGALKRFHEERVRPEWVDYNGHMNVAYYVLVFDHATDAFLESIGMDEDLRERTGSSVFVAEAHVTYDQEVLEGEQVYITTQLVDFDAKRIHVFHRMYRGADDALAATNELMILQVNLKDRRVGPFEPDVQAHIEAIAADHAALPKPEHCGRAIGIPRRQP